MSEPASTRVNESENNAYHSKGATFTGNPRYTGPNEPIEEKPGTITSDSLAAESLSDPSGSFAANQSGIAASGQPSKGFSGNTTDTQGATVIPPSNNGLDGAGAGEGSGEPSYTTPRDEAKETSAAYSAGAGSGVYDTSAGGPQTSLTGSGSSAPTAYSTSGSTDDANLKPKPHGKNITEGGFDADAPNASEKVFDTDAGSRDDPSRVAEGVMAGRTLRSGGDAGYENASNKDGGRDQGGFENLGGDTSA